MSLNRLKKIIASKDKKIQELEADAANNKLNETNLKLVNEDSAMICGLLKELLVKMNISGQKIMEQPMRSA